MPKLRAVALLKTLDENGARAMQEAKSILGMLVPIKGLGCRGYSTAPWKEPLQRSLLRQLRNVLSRVFSFIRNVYNVACKLMSSKFGAPLYCRQQLRTSMI